jgi:hypothetical protein
VREAGRTCDVGSVDARRCPPMPADARRCPPMPADARRSRAPAGADASRALLVLSQQWRWPAAVLPTRNETTRD